MTERSWADVTQKEKDRMRLWRDVGSTMSDIATQFELPEHVVIDFFTGRLS